MHNGYPDIGLQATERGGVVVVVLGIGYTADCKKTLRTSREGFATFRECPTSRSSSEGLTNFAIAMRYRLIASIAKVSRPHRDVVVAKVSRRICDMRRMFAASWFATEIRDLG